MPGSFNLTAVRRRLPALQGDFGRDPRFVVRLVLGLLLLANIVAALVLFKPWGGSAEELERRLAGMDQQAVQKQASVVTLQNLVSKVEKARGEGDLFMKDYFLSERSAYSMLVAELTEVAGKAKIKIKDHSFTEEPIEGAEHLKMLSISANYEGTYADLVEFVNMLDRSPRFLIIENLTATPQQSGGALNVNIKLDTFMRAEEVAP